MHKSLNRRKKETHRIIGVLHSQLAITFNFGYYITGTKRNFES